MQVTRVSDAPYERARAELARYLPPAEAGVLEALGISGFVAYATVARGGRALGRLEQNREDLERAMGAIRTGGLECVRSRFDMLSGREAVGGTFHSGRLVPRDTEPEARAVLYFSHRREFALAADVVERAENDRLAGRLFGYPECCIDFFERTGGGQDKTPACVAGLGPFPRALNPVVGLLYGIRLLFHFPCSTSCAASAALVEERLRHLRQYAPSLEDFDRCGAGLLLYGPRLGIALATRYRPVGDDVFLLDEVVTRRAQSFDVFSTLPGAPIVRYLSPHRFEVGGLQCHDDQSVIARFE
jgi:hypothetical protein